MTEGSAMLNTLAEERAKKAETKAVNLEARLGVAENERDVAVKTAEAGDAINHDLTNRLDEMAQKVSRTEGVNEVLKEQLRERTQAPAFDPQPILDAVKRVEDNINQNVAPKVNVAADGLTQVRDRLAAVEGKVAAAPVSKPPVVQEKKTVVRRGFGWWWIPVGVVLLLLLGILIWWMVSNTKLSSQSIPAAEPHPSVSTVLPPSVPAVETPELPVVAPLESYQSTFDSTDDSIDEPVIDDFRADCAAHGGEVYTAEQWNAKSGAHLVPGQLHCNASAYWKVDP